METNRENQIDEKIENPEATGDKQGIRDDKGRFIEGVSGNPDGRPKGSKNFETDFLEAVGKIAEANNITRAEAMEILLRKAYSEAKNGQYNFYKDIMDRLYGKVMDNTNVKVDLPQSLIELISGITKHTTDKSVSGEDKN